MRKTGEVGVSERAAFWDGREVILVLIWDWEEKNGEGKCETAVCSSGCGMWMVCVTVCFFVYWSGIFSPF